MDTSGLPVILGAVIIGVVVRLLKEDTKIPITIRPAARPAFAFFLGMIDGIANRAATGMPWQLAIEYGALASFTAIASHDVVVEGMRRGREFVVPGLSIPPPKMRSSRASYSEIVLPPAPGVTSIGDASPDDQETKP